MDNKNKSEFSIPLFCYEEWDFLRERVLSISALLFICTTTLSAQVQPEFIGSLPAIIMEASGLQCPTPELCYIFNDSNDDSRIYRIGTNGQFISQLIIEGVIQEDFEDIAYSEDGRLFIGDFGNNNNNRQDLRIHILTDYSGSVTVPSTIEFTYEDQMDFPPSASDLNYDVEAMIHWQDSLFLFTRNRTSPYNGLTKIYSLPDLPGLHTAVLRGEVFGNLSELHNSITAADISPSGNRIAWLTNGSLFLFSSPMMNLSEEVPAYNFFNQIRDFEGVSFVDDCNLLLVEEGETAGIYTLNTCDILTGIGVPSQDNDFQVYQRGETLYVASELGTVSVRIIDYLGRALISQDYNAPILLTHLSAGSYIALVTLGNKSYSHRFQITGN